MKYFLFVIDSFGIGADEEAEKYDDLGANTALNVSRAIGGKKWGFLGKMGLGNICEDSGFRLSGCSANKEPIANYCKLKKVSPGKDTQTGHWEIAGLRVEKPMIIFPQKYPSFNREIIDKIEKATGKKVIGNCGASGTEIIKQLGEEQKKEKSIIVYTSADSVLQIAANEENIPVEELYDICVRVRKIADEQGIGRVIARPYIQNEKGEFVRTNKRRDYGVELPGRTIMEKELPKLSVTTVGVGKIGDIFNEQGIDISFHDHGNTECFERCENILTGKEKIPDRAFVFVNLVDTDMVYGHRRNPVGYCKCVQEISEKLEKYYKLMDKGDVLAVTADHGCDPCYKGTDHTREYVPFLWAEKGNENGKNLSEKGYFEGFDYAIKNVVEYFTR